MSANLLIAAAIDLDGSDPFDHFREQIVSSLKLGLAGDVCSARIEGGLLALRRDRPLAANPQVRRFAPKLYPGGYYLILAGRIMDRDNLRSRTGLPSIGDDSDLYAAAFERFGDACDSHITGDYAAIQWFPSQRRLRLARSPVSNAPLHVWRNGRRIVVGSIPRALFAAGAPARIDDAMLTDSLLLNPYDERQSWYTGLERVPCGSVVDHFIGGREERQVWDAESVPGVKFARDEDYVEAVHEQFGQALKATLDGVERPGILLSGGLDSQAVASYALDVMPPDARLPAFTQVPMEGWTPPPRPAKFGDEGPYVRALAEMYPQLEPEFIDGADRRYGDKLDQLFLLGSWPTHNEMNGHFAHASLERAASKGCDVVLCGDLGNTGFSYDGETGFPTWLRQGQWRRLLREVRLSSDARPFWRKLISRSVMPHLPVGLRCMIDKPRGYLHSPFASWCPMREDAAIESGALGRASASGPELYGYDFSTAIAWRKAVLKTITNGAPEILLAFRLLHGVERRDPTAYLPLLELCMGIPDEQYLRDGQDRWLARRLLKGRIPDKVRTERRSGMQTADWPLRFMRERERLLVEMASMSGDERLARVFDFDRMSTDLREWPGTDIPADNHNLRIAMAIGRGVATARFVRYVEGRNVG